MGHLPEKTPGPGQVPGRHVIYSVLTGRERMTFTHMEAEMRCVRGKKIQ